MAGIAAETLQMAGIGSEIGDARIDHTAGTLHQLRQTALPAALGRSFNDKPEAFLDQILKLAAA